MKLFKKFFIISIMLMGIYILFSTEEVQAKSVNSIVKHSRKIYYTTNGKLKSYKKTGETGKYTDYWNMKKQYLVKTIIYPNYYDDTTLKKYTVEYYYDSSLKLVFAFAYRKIDGKVKEYRTYYGAGGKLYRFINAKGKIKDYKNGRDMYDQGKGLPYLLYKKGMENFIAAQESWIPDSAKIY